MPPRDFPRALVQSFLRGAVVPFVGAGVSRSVRKQDGAIAFPTWNELLEKGAAELVAQQQADEADFVRASLRVKRDPTETAEFIRDKLGGRTWVDFLKRHLAVPKSALQESSLALPRAIWDLRGKLVVTTNFDKVLTFAHREPTDVRPLDIDNFSGFADVMSGDLDQPTVWHLHGHIDNPGRMILTSQAYNQLYSSQDALTQSYNAALQALRDILASKTLLFIGFSFADEYLRRQLEWLVKTFHTFAHRHFALIHQDELEHASAALTPLQVTPIPFANFGEPLVQTVRDIGLLVGKEMVGGSEFQAPGEDEAPTPIEDRWQKSQAIRLMDSLGPTYILDRRYFLIDWNPAFERLFAKPLGLFRGQHAQEFVRSLVNRELVDEHSKEAFPDDREPPLVDMEPLFFQSPEFGLIKLWKIASRIIDEQGDLSGWSVALNVLGADDLEALWREVKRVLDERVNWSLYAPRYDELLHNFDEYSKLVALVCSKLGSARNCADLGAGTGNGTLELLRQHDQRTVWAIEPNEEMLVRLRGKVEDDPALKNRVNFVKQGIARLGGFEPGYFDGAIMINVLYAVDEPEKCMQEVARILAPGGVLALSTPHRDTDVGQLFSAMRANFADKALWPALRESLEEAFERHSAMMEKIHRDTKDDIRRYLENAGFAVEDWLDGQYAGSVVVVKAVKR